MTGNYAVFSPAWMPGGNSAIFFRREKAWDDLGAASLEIFDFGTKAVRKVGASFEYFSRIVGTGENWALVCGQIDNVNVTLFRVDTVTGAIKRYERESAVQYGISVANGGRIWASVRSDQNRFLDIVVNDRAKRRSLVKEYRFSYSELTPRRGERRLWKSSDGTEVEGIYFPAYRQGAPGGQGAKAAQGKQGQQGAKGAEPAPMVVIIHGGPVVSMWDCLFMAYRDRMSPYPITALLESGISVLLPNYRGSAGYGSKFREEIRGQLGVLESQDIVAGINALVQTGEAEIGQVGVAGWSYGGFLAALLTIEYPELITCSSVGAGFVTGSWQLALSCGNMESYFRWDQDGDLGSGDINLLERLLRSKRKIPPVFIQFGENDKVVPPVHGESLFALLRRKGGKARFVKYKQTGHVISRPAQLLEARKHNLQWFREHLVKKKKNKK